MKTSTQAPTPVPTILYSSTTDAPTPVPDATTYAPTPVPHPDRATLSADAKVSTKPVLGTAPTRAPTPAPPTPEPTYASTTPAPTPAPTEKYDCLTKERWSDEKA